jgi:hypothetical protein
MILDSGVMVKKAEEILKEDAVDKKTAVDEVDEDSETDVYEDEPIILDTKTRTLSTSKGEVYLTTYIKNDKKMIRIQTENSVTIPLSTLTTYVMRNDLSTIDQLFVDRDEFLCIISFIIVIFAVATAGLFIWILSISEIVMAR